jgi:hypothetical protein
MGIARKEKERTFILRIMIFFSETHQDGWQLVFAKTTAHMTLTASSNLHLQRASTLRIIAAPGEKKRNELQPGDNCVKRLG